MKHSASGFTLIELLVTLVIIATLTSLIAPQVGALQKKAESVKCSSNLRQIGVSVQLYSQDNDNRFPAVESMPSDPVYGGGNGAAQPVFAVLSPYGVTKAMLQCPSDIRGPNYFAKEGSSYQWMNIVDDELVSNPQVYTRFGVRNPRTPWLMLARDYENVHNGHGNRLYADGHVRTY